MLACRKGKFGNMISDTGETVESKVLSSSIDGEMKDAKYVSDYKKLADLLLPFVGSDWSHSTEIARTTAEKAIVELIPTLDPDCFFYTPSLSHGNSLFHKVIVCSHSELTLKAMLTLLNKSGKDLNSLYYSVSKLASDSNIRAGRISVQTTPIDVITHFCYAHYSRTADQLRNSIALLFNAGICPAKDVYIPSCIKQEVLMCIEEESRKYHRSVSLKLADTLSIFSLDLVSMVADYAFFKPLSVPAAIPSAQPQQPEDCKKPCKPA